MTAPTDEDATARLQRSWQSNAQPWTRAVRERRIASRRAGTDAAIVDALLASGARRILDLGCGEGWLARALAARGCDVVGVDGSAALVEAARGLGGARYACASYAGLVANPGALGVFDAVACNFALLDADLATPLAAARACLPPRGRLFVQTLHPLDVTGPYEDGWRLEEFGGLEGFAEPMPWYFRTLSGWCSGLDAAGFVVDAIDEPLDPATRRPLSLLLRTSLRDAAGPR
ncbi:class I SAM-dependent methyltransferase [Dokdonella sp.]|uniref:class I SAM-dependent methyltransferase n=1 Tax=Dokdonella sp. TaxID=2291710 RepID=UPI002F405706